eukprot:COSAG02_NODE_6473_length_3551_cov_1.385863_3_plen_115_part_00
MRIIHYNIGIAWQIKSAFDSIYMFCEMYKQSTEKPDPTDVSWQEVINITEILSLCVEQSLSLHLRQPSRHGMNANTSGPRNCSHAAKLPVHSEAMNQHGSKRVELSLRLRILGH